MAASANDAHDRRGPPLRVAEATLGLRSHPDLGERDRLTRVAVRHSRVLSRFLSHVLVELFLARSLINCDRNSVTWPCAGEAGAVKRTEMSGVS